MRADQDIDLDIFVRCYSRLLHASTPQKRASEETPMPQWARDILVIDCETTTGLDKKLNFGFWRWCRLQPDSYYACLEEGIFYRDDLDAKSVKLLRQFAHSHKADVAPGGERKMLMMSCDEFVNGPLWNIFQAGGCLVGYNLPFDISMLAHDCRPTKNGNGWSFVMFTYPNGREDKYRPRITVVSKDSYTAFIRLNKTLPRPVPCSLPVTRGRFLDLAHLVFALRNQHLTLKSACKEFRIPGKLDHKPTGRVTPEEIRYARQDVAATLNLLNAIKRELEGFRLSIRPEKVFSAASLTKSLLRDMGLARPQDKFDIPGKRLGCAAQAYHGGHVECRIRRTDVPCVVYDVTSEYPTAAALLGVWDIIRAKEIRVEDCTQEARELLSNLTIEQLFDRSMWRQLAFFAKIKPDGELLPARARYDGRSKTIGINHLSADYPLWFAGPELAAVVVNGQTPQIIEAFRIVPVGSQDGLKTVKFGNREFNPANEDFFVKIIEERYRLKQVDKNHPHVLLLKIIANSLYGCFAEMNTKTRSKRRSALIEVFSGDYHLVQRSCNVEVPGDYNFWPTASLITAGGRLLLALAEKLIAQQAGGCHAMMDTDSIVVVASRTEGPIPCENGPERMPDASPAIKALTWERADQALNRFDSLSPYDPKLVPHLFKKEDENFAADGKTQMELRYFGISSKNYVLFRGTPQNPEIIKPSQHGIGTYFRPDPRSWIQAKNCACTDKYHPLAFDDWRMILRQYASGCDGILGEVASTHPFIDKLAVRRIRVSTPRELASLRKIDPEKAKPFTFAVSPILIENPHASNQVLIGASLDPEDWQTQDYVDADTGEIFKLAIPGKDDDPRQPYPRTYLSALHQHTILKESKYPGGDGQGLLGRYHVHAHSNMPRLLGKEVERKQAAGDNLAEMRIYEPPEYEIKPKQAQVMRKTLHSTIIDELKSKYSIKKLAKKTGLSRNTVARAFRDELIQPRSWQLLMKVFETTC